QESKESNENKSEMTDDEIQKKKEKDNRKFEQFMTLAKASVNPNVSTFLENLSDDGVDDNDNNANDNEKKKEMKNENEEEIKKKTKKENLYNQNQIFTICNTRRTNLEIF
ncbi:zinc finger protein, partial [Reticulomyxa filosa]